MQKDVFKFISLSSFSRFFKNIFLNYNLYSFGTLLLVKL